MITDTPDSPQAVVMRGGRRRARRRKITLDLAGDQSVTFTGGELTLDGVIATLEELIAAAKKAKGQHLQLSTWILVLNDQSQARAGN